MARVNYNRGMLYAEYTRRVLTEAALNILKDQRSAVSITYNRRRGDVSDSLSNNIIKIGNYSGGVQLHFDYALALRYLDMRKDSSGKKKKRYAPVYNKILYGHFYGVIVPALRYGLNSSIEQEIIEELKQSYNQLGNGNQ